MNTSKLKPGRERYQIIRQQRMMRLPPSVEVKVQRTSPKSLQTKDEFHTNVFNKVLHTAKASSKQ